MKTILRVLLAASVATLLTACALLQPLDTEARRSAKILLTAYEATQQAILIYGRLPDCQTPGPRLCKDHNQWRKIKIAEAAATTAIAEGTGILVAIANLNAALMAAQTKLKGDAP